MKTTAIIFLTIFSWLYFCPSANNLGYSNRYIQINPDYETVYICTGEYATKYHKTKNCSGLNNCKGAIDPIELSDAINIKKRTACLICYKDR